MPGAAVTGRTVIETTRFSLGQGDKILEVFGGQTGVDHIQAGHLGQQRDRFEVFVGVKRQLVVNKRVHGKSADVPQDEGVAIGALRAFLHGNVATSTGLVFNKHALAQGFAEFIGSRPRHNFRTAPRGKRYQQSYRFAGPRGFRKRRKGACCGQCAGCFKG